MRGKVGGLSPPYFKSRGAIAPLAPLLPPPLIYVYIYIYIVKTKQIGHFCLELSKK